MNIQTTKTRVRNSLSFNGKLGLKLKIFRIWFDGDVPRAQVNLWNPLSYIHIVIATLAVSLWKISEAAMEIFFLIKQTYFGVGYYRKNYGEPTWFKDLPEN